jgi:hypothetical protein
LRLRAANPVSGLADADEASTAFLGVTTLALIATGAAAGGGQGLGLAAVAGEPAHPRDGGYRTTNKGTTEQAQCPASRDATVGQSPGESVEGSLPLRTVATPSLGGNFPVSVFGCH